MSPAKTAEPIEVPFGVCTGVGQMNHVLHEGADCPGKGTIKSGSDATGVIITLAIVFFCILGNNVTITLNLPKCKVNRAGLEATVKHF